MLQSETNTRAVERRIRGEARAILRKRDLQTDFEHGQWWVTHRPSGAQWSVVDTNFGFDFEQVTGPDES